MARFSTGIIGANEIRRLFCMIMIFSSPISREVRKFWRLNPIKDAPSDEGPLSDPEFGSTSSTGSSAYGEDEVSSMLHFVDKDALACGE